MPRAKTKSISEPSKFRHVCHVRFDKESGMYVDMPPAWREILREKEQVRYPDSSKLSETEISSAKEEAVIRGTCTVNTSLPDIPLEQDIQHSNDSSDDTFELATLIVDLPPLTDDDEYSKSCSKLARDSESPGFLRHGLRTPVLGRSSSDPKLNTFNGKCSQSQKNRTFARHWSERYGTIEDRLPQKVLRYKTLNEYEMSLSLRYGLDQFETRGSQSETCNDFVSSESLRRCYNEKFSSQRSIPIPDSNFNPIPDSILTNPIPDSKSGFNYFYAADDTGESAITTINHVFEKATTMTFLQYIYEYYPPRIPDYNPPCLSDTMDFEQCKRAYRAAILHYHPDRQNVGLHGTGWKQLCVEITKLLTRHYGVYKVVTTF